MKNFFTGFFAAVLALLCVAAASTSITKFRDISLRNITTMSPAVADGTNPYLFDTVSNRTTGSSFKLNSAGTNYAEFSFDGAASPFFKLKSDGSQDNMVEMFAYPGASGIQLYVDSNRPTELRPGISDGSTPYTFDTSILHTSGSLFDVKNMVTNVLTLAVSGANRYIQTLSADGTGANQVGMSSGVDAGDNSIGVVENSVVVFLANGNGIATADPGVGGVAPFKFGNILTCSAITLVVTNYIPVSINGNTNFVIPLATFTP